MKIIFVGGGTGGHVLPNIAIIDDLMKISKKKGIDIDFIYIGRFFGIEKRIVLSRGIRYKGIFAGKWRRYGNWRNYTDLLLIALGFIQSIFILLLNRPKIIFAKGGFVTVPLCMAAALLRIPFLIHESDSILGLSNKILLRFAKKIYLGFPVEEYQNLPIGKCVFTGNPVREEISSIVENKQKFYKKYGLNPKKPIVFVFGGSQGSSAINKHINEILDKLVAKYVLIHQTGVKEANYFKQGYFELDEKDRKDYLIYSHIGEEMGEMMANADLVVSRAGANSIAEIIALKKIAIIIPLPSAAADHQSMNAQFLKEIGVASILDEKFLDGEKFLEEIDFMIKDKKTRNRMIKNMESIFPENSSKIIAEEIIKEISK
ncbi:MAG TPA: undecaprenyldiphospho-muramoylpentapeptide beta-N-acetylglucosaminyltransferase [Patescibacteria group bacterium]|nr:undecaprenyldiphospho-muramoylpentapeptide beta-N-acetylglucosaminyltransferase [Patescibacteria group bacterium]